MGKRKENIMTRLEKLIGCPVPQEHRKQLKERMETYENCDRTTLISLLLQYDLEFHELHDAIDKDFVCKQDFINKACDELRDMTDDRLGDSFINDFRRRLEE